MGGLDGGQTELIKKLVNFRMDEGKRTIVRAIVYQTFHRPARTEHDVIKLMVDIVDNIKPICEVEKVRVAGTIYDVPGIVARDRQHTLAIRWIHEAAFKRRISYMISLEKCSFADILDDYRKRRIALRKGRIFMDWLPPIEVSRISDGSKGRILGEEVSRDSSSESRMRGDLHARFGERGYPDPTIIMPLQ